MIDLNKMVQGLAQSGIASGFVGGAAGGALTSALMSKQGRKSAKTLLKVGGLAAVGGLAWKAYQSYRQTQPSGEGVVQTPDHGSFTSDHGRGEALVWASSDSKASSLRTEGGEQVTEPMLLIRAMIAAAMADGHIDGGEQDRIFAEVNRLDLSGEEKALLFDELRHPLSLEELARQARDPRIGTEVYAASLLAIDETRADGRAYLERLAERLSLPQTLVEALHARAILAKRSGIAA